MKKLLSFFILFALMLGACERDTTNDAFAQCINDSGAIFYGAFWCPHCQNQKKLFDDSKDLLPYVECDPNGKNPQAALCNAENITSYPTWKFTDGTVKTGELDFETLSTLANCPLPGEESVMVQD